MKRCETLVVTRDESKARIKKLEESIAEEERNLTAFKDAQNERMLKLR